ncbi:hypothetical protein [Massilibacteroides sp.]|uniref:hypothetical protein n=1 Tax=Massilibacteroides sp. TaxID=2034766 RepID=UPI0026177486|nr:hypothetical protein [Massilibacteroides sp.]MDD4516503.1 hypothetical protein [Massilibacteroides sp.]
MAKKRILKKNISYVAGELFTDALLCNLFIKGIDKERTEVVMSRILRLEESFINRANHPDAKDNKKLVKKYYKDLLVDLQAEADAIGKEIEELTKDVK